MNERETPCRLCTHPLVAHANCHLDMHQFGYISNMVELSNKLGDETNWHGSVGKVSTAAVPLL